MFFLSVPTSIFFSLMLLEVGTLSLQLGMSPTGRSGVLAPPGEEDGHRPGARQRGERALHSESGSTERVLELLLPKLPYLSHSWLLGTNPLSPWAKGWCVHQQHAHILG